MLTFYFSGVKGENKEEDILTSGMVGKQVKLEFSPEWDGLQKTVVFSAGDVTRDALLQGDAVTIPHEVLAQPLKQLCVGVYGVSADGTLVIPTIRALGPAIQPGATPSDDPGTSPELEIWAQLQLQQGDLTQLDTENKESLVAAINELATSVDGKDAVLTMFISPDGSDSNDGLSASTPKKTVKACVNAGATRICAKRGVYKEIVQFSNIGSLEILPSDNDLTYAAGVEREPIVFDTSDTVAVSSLADYNSIKRVAYSNSANTQFDKVFTKQSQTPVVGTGYGSRYNATVWLLSEDEKTVCIKLKPVLTVAACEAEANTFSYVDGYIYINADMTSVEKVIVPTNWDSGIHIDGADRVVLKEVEVRFSGTYNINIKNCAYFHFYKCACKYTSYGSGFHPFNSNGRMTACYATKNYDGYGISGYGHTTYIDCVSEFNFDDGMSHHNATTGTVIGGRYEGNGKGGNAPAYGAKVNIYGGLYKDNGTFGIGYLWATDLEPAGGMVQGAVMAGNPIGLSVNANCDVVAMNCTYQDNTTDTDAKGNLTEYNANYVKTVNGMKPDENGNVEIDVSGSGGEETSPTNVLPLAINTDGTEYVGAGGEDGYNPGYRISSSGTEKASTINSCTGFIACKAGDVIRVKNITTEASGYSQAYFYTSAFEKTTGAVQLFGDSFTQDANGVYSFTVPEYADIAYTRLTVGAFTSDSIITVNEEIS